VEQTLGSSLQDQQNAITAHAAKLGLKVAKFFVESESGIHEKVERREQMRALRAEVREGDLIVCDKIDRWSRDPEFSHRSIREILEAGASFYAVGDGCDPSTAEGDTMLGFRILFAREEHKRIRQRLVGTRKLLRDKGLYVEGLAPWGYRRQENKGAERNVLVVEPTEAEQIREAFRLCIAGKSIDAIANALGVRASIIARALNRRLYVGEIQDAEGAWIRGKHPAIVDAKTYQAARDALTSRTNGSRSPQDGSAETSTWWLRDVAVCGLCGAKMGAAYAGPKGKGRRYYFKCTAKCTSRFVPVWVAEESMEMPIWDRLTELRTQLAKPPVVKPVPVVDLRERRAKVERRREKYLEMHADGLTSRDELRTQLAKVDAERLRLDAMEVVEPPKSLADMRALLRSAGRAARQWVRMPAVRRRLVANQLLLSVGLASDKRPRPVWREATEMDVAEVSAALLTGVTFATERADAIRSAKFIKKLRGKQG